MNKLLIFLGLLCCFSFTTFALTDRQLHEERSFCDSLADGYHCDGDRLYKCYNGDVSWSWSCVTDQCVADDSTFRCEFASDATFCENKWSPESRSGAYCVDETTFVSCGQNGDEYRSNCATNAEPDATCEEFDNIDWAYCDYPPKCDLFPSNEVSDLSFCTGPFSPEGRDIPVPVTENVTLYDEKAEEFASQLAASIYPETVTEKCSYLMKSTSCYVSFPDCPGHNDCLLVCEQLKGCAEENKNDSTITSISCEDYCGQFAAASSVSYSLALFAFIALVAAFLS